MGEAPSGTVLFLVERYWPDVTVNALEQAVADVEEAADRMSRTGRPVRHLQSVLAVPEEVVFSLFEAPSAEAVARVNRLSRFPFERVIDAVMAGGQMSRGDNR